MRKNINFQRGSSENLHFFSIPKKIKVILSFALLFMLSQYAFSQSISGTGTSNSVCWDCVPTGWVDATGTPDISNRDVAAASGTLGGGATWASAPLPLPPSGDVRWVTLRDVGPDFSEESISTTITGLTVGKLYKLTMYLMTTKSNTNGNGSYYAGTYMDQFDYELDNNGRQSLTILSQETWSTVSFIFVAKVTSPVLALYPRKDGNYRSGGNSIDLETVNISINSVNALEILDSDGDGIDDSIDIDDDNDGILDTEESGGNDPNGDVDGDGLPNYLDTNGGALTDVNNDGVPDSYDFDLDGIANHLDLDSDGDGILDIIEAQLVSGYIPKTGGVGTNGYYDVYETVADNGTPRFSPINTDGSGVDKADYLDIDSDNDGIPDNVEAQSTAGYITPTGNVGSNGVDSVYENIDNYTPTGITLIDTDVDAIQDYRDSDSDADGTPDIEENGDADNTVSGVDTDGDGLDDNFDSDNVNYDVNDNINNPASDLPNADSGVDAEVDYRDAITGLDTDDDGIPDNVDIDDDNDGILDVNEGVSCITIPNAPVAGVVDGGGGNGVSASDYPLINNSDLTADTGIRMNRAGEYIIVDLGSLIPIGEVIRVHLWKSNNNNKTLRLAQLPNGTVNLGGGTNPQTINDTDIIGVHVMDYPLTVATQYLQIEMTSRNGGRIEIIEATVLSYFKCITDTDGDGIIDSLDIDSDNDGIIDNVEAQSTAGFVAKSGNDSDGDGLDDAYDDTPNGNSDGSGSNGITIAELINTDGSFTNSDTIPDYLDIDSDNDGIPDNIEAQTSTGYTPPNNVPGVNGLDSAYDFTDNYASVGLSNTLVNTDGDAQPDYRDIDSDGDATNDVDEGLTSITAGTFGTDTDNDGLDDIYEHGTTNDGFIVNDGITDPKTAGLIDVDFDVSTGGDLDYRDSVNGSDTDGDGIVDSIDIDDDNDGILDTVEDVCSTPSARFQGTPDAYWSLDNNTNDISGNNFNQGSGTNTPTFSTTAIQGTHSASFNGTSNVIRYSVDGSFMEGTYTTISFSAWIQPSSLTGNRVIYEEGGGTNGAVLWLNGNVLTFSARTGGSGSQVNVTHPSTLTLDGLWHHVAATYDNGNMTVYLNGIASGTTLAGFTTILGHGDNGGIGGNIGGTSAGITGRFQGLIDAARYSNSEAWPLSRIQFEAQKICDFDEDGIPDSKDLDSDNDGILDLIEAQTTAGYIAPTGSVGANGYYDVFETAVDSGTPLFTAVTTVNDGKPDYLDIDSDDDGIPDNVEAQTTQGYIVPNGIFGINGIDTAYKTNDTYTATALTPVESGGTANLPDFRDTDSDGDGLLDSAESGITPNGGSGDSDGDGLLDIYEGGNLNDIDVNDEINNPLTDLSDDDGDANSTGDLDYRDSSSDLDKDADGILDAVDLDDDNDGILDSVEDANTDMDNDPTTNPTDSDGDGIPDHLDIDSDNDGIPDNIEAQTSSGYISPSGIGTGITDANSDGVDDNYAGGLTPINTDGVDNPDYLDDDADADGILDIAENGDPDNTVSGTDTDNDGLDDNFEGNNLNDADVNDEINNPLVNLPDTDGDSGSGGDVDFRDDTDDSVPVGVAGNVLWLRADKNVTGTATVTGWGDQTTPAFNATASNPPSKIDNGLNFNPTIRFDGTNDFMQITNGVLGNASYTDIWVYAVSMSNSATTAAYTVSQGTAAQTLYLQAPDTGSNLAFQFGNATELTTAWGGATGEFSLWNAGSSTNTSTPSTTNKAIYRNGLQLATNGSGDNITSTNQNLYLGSVDGSGSFMDGDIAEVMVFTNVPSSARQQQIQSYLAIKYGITLSNTDNDATIAEGDYILEDLSTKIWDKTANSTYHNDIAGIGRDDAMALIQKQSISVNSDATITIGLGSIAATNATNASNLNSNKSFLVWGNNGATLTNSTSKTLLCAPEVQLDRVWKIVETGSVGTVQIAITQENVNGFVIDNVLNTANTIKVLKVADDANFTTNVKHIPVTSTSINGVNQYVANFNFNGTKYFTYSEINGIFWNGDTASWTGGAGTSGAPSGLTADVDKVVVVDAETSLTNITMTANAIVECVWIKANSKLMIADDRYLEFDENFVLDGEIRLIGDAQLVQTHAGLSNVQGNGKLYRDQKSLLPNVYRYNYWSSPVVKTLGDVKYQVADVMKDGTGPTAENSALKNINFDSGASVYDGATTDPITIASYWIFSYFNGTTGADWVQKRQSADINVAEGYTMKSTGRNPQTYTFYGTPNSGVYSKTVSAGTASLVGNPYPSVLDSQTFITDNSSVLDGTLYFWEHKGEAATSTVTEGHNLAGYEGGYSQRNQAMGVAANSIVAGTAGLGNETYTAPTRYIAVGQGFFVSASSGGTFTFSNSQRTFNTDNIFFKGQETNVEIPTFKLGMEYTNSANVSIHRQLGINFKEGNSFAYESGFDSETYDLQKTDIYWDFPQIESNLIIAGIGKITSELQVPLGIVLDEDQIVKIMIDEKNSMDEYDMYLVDLLTGQILTLSVPVELNLSKGTYTDRFIIIFGGEALGTDPLDLFTKGVLIFRDNLSNEIVIKNNLNLQINNVALYTVLGQEVASWNKLGSTIENRLKTNQLTSGVYIVKINSNKGQFSKKIIFAK